MGSEGFTVFQEERGESDVYYLTAIQADAILKMTLGQLVNLEQEKLSGQFQALLDEIKEYLRILSDDQHILDIIKADLGEIKKNTRIPAGPKSQAKKSVISISRI